MIYPRTFPDPDSVARHYDSLDRWYLEIWGEHVHHGLWESGRETPEEAVRRLVVRVAEATGIGPGTRVCDVGCGYGGPARLLAEEYGASVLGVTLSKAQYEFALARRTDAGNPSFLLRDWLRNDLPDGAFDVVIAIESSEHVQDKQAFFAEAHRVLVPGGRIGVCAWLTRDTPLFLEARHLLEPICREGRLPGMGSEQDYYALFDAAGFQDCRFGDLSARVRRTWPICVGRLLRRLIKDHEARRFLLCGPEDRIFGLTILRIWLALRLGAMRYGLFTAQKCL